MTAFACLRVLPPPQLQSRQGLEGLINRYACVFLETRWSWPRRFEVMALTSFLLVDPRAERLEMKCLQDLSYDLQLRLFGSSGDGGMVELVAFEGDPDEVARFANLEPDELRRAMIPEALTPPLVGRMTRITVDQVCPVAMPGSPDPEAPSGPGRSPPPEQPLTPSFSGIYFAPREAFLGCVVGGRETGYSLVDGSHPRQREAARAHDARVIALAADILDRQPTFVGACHLPVCYASLIHRQEREDYQTWLQALPRARRGNLAVSVYDTPRDPSFSALSQVKTFLDPYFRIVDLQTLDPEFAVERLAFQAVHSVTLVLPDASPLARIAAIRRFADRIPLFRQKRIWPAITNVRNAVEFESCLARRIPFVSGQAVTASLSQPVGALALPPDQLPLDDHVLRQTAVAGVDVATA